MKKKFMSRFLCALLSVLMLVSIVPAIAVSAETAAAEDEEELDYTKIPYESAEARLAAMTCCYNSERYALYCDEMLGVVGYLDKKTGETLFTNPWNMMAEENTDASVRNELMSQIIMTYIRNDAKDVEVLLNSYADAAIKGQIITKPIKNGIRVEYAIGERSARILVPMIIEREAFIEKVANPLIEALGYAKAYREVLAYFNPVEYTTAKGDLQQQIVNNYPVTAEKGINLYVFNHRDKQVATMRKIEAYILQYCPNYSFEEMDNDYAYVNYSEASTSPAVFKMALEYTVSEDGSLLVTLPANGLRYDEEVYRIVDLQILPYMGAKLKSNEGKTGEEGYSFIPDGSGTTYKLSTSDLFSARVYGDDFALMNGIEGLHSETIRVPVFGQVDAVYDKETDTTTRSGYLAIIEDGASLASIYPNHQSYQDYTSVYATFITRQSDKTDSNWDVYAGRRYTEDYAIRYILLTDDPKTEEEAERIGSYYECTWMGMACAYRDYLARTNKGFQRLTEEDINPAQIPLYIETFGCMDTVEKVLSMPVTVSVALTTFDQVGEMYDFLSGGENGIVNVNFKLKGFANGGLYSDVPYKLKWESAVGGKSDFKDLIEKAVEQGFGVYPDFDFVYTTQADGGNAVNMKKNAARTVDNRYTSKRVYFATKQDLVSYYQMVLAPATYSKFYEKLEKRYAKYEGATGISLSTFGNALNADYDEEKTSLREETMDYVTEALAYFKDRNYDIMLEGGNAYTWNYADHILNAPLDSSRYNKELAAVPFVGVVLHGYVEFAGSALNMEGDIGYAMLKAMENGASIYFVLSYANTELLKEDVLLSQNYSVRYDIWQNRLVEIYHELNDVLFDVQTKLIIGYERLAGTRVPDADELLSDILQDAQDKADAIEDLIVQNKGDRQQAIQNAQKNVADAKQSIVSAKAPFKYDVDAIDPRGSHTAANDFINAWDAYKNASNEEKDAKLAALRSAFSSKIVQTYASAGSYLTRVGNALVSAKQGYDHLRAAAAQGYYKDTLLTKAATQLEEAIDEYLDFYNMYHAGKFVGLEWTYETLYTLTAQQKADFVAQDLSGLTAEEVLAQFHGLLPAVTPVSVSQQDAIDFVRGELADSSAYAVLSMDAIWEAYKLALEADGLYDPDDSASSAVDIDAMYAATQTPVTPPSENEGDDDTDEGYNKYMIDNSIVRVTYGEGKTAFKTLILNFNDYTVRTVYNGVTYTIEAYGYVEIYH